MPTDERVATRQPPIPVIDLGACARGETPACTALGEALEQHGFFYLRHHGVPVEVLQGVFAAARTFFALPPAAKEAVRWQSAATNRGYGGLTSQALDTTRLWDLKEIFQAGPEHPDAPPNRWPPELPALRAAVLAFYDAARAAGDRLLAAMARALGLPAAYFAPHFARPLSTVRLLHYPPLAGAPPPGQLRAGAHTDFGALTLLFNDAAGGLEIQLADGTWLPVPPRPEAAIVNTGDLLERWTNGRFRSSPHRVAVPSGPAAARARYSVVLFHSPSADTVVAPLPTCQSATRPPRYPPVRAGDHLLARLKATHRAAY
ncbi:MAG TPA: 2-oxoglutarate and iron-dependent oxygenase domain-containing protein [Chloroflexota bacterium]|nr:2-oxoglutarate and iron-dependent oxygenase domain-containing protein [Chloroflexota bacterium]